jgi:hypothetical protein
MTGFLMATIPDENRFYSLYCDGLYAWKHYDGLIKATRIIYAKDALVVLYYTYPTHREACVIRNRDGSRSFPGLSKKVSPLFSVQPKALPK